MAALRCNAGRDIRATQICISGRPRVAVRRQVGLSEHVTVKCTQVCHGATLRASRAYCVTEFRRLLVDLTMNQTGVLMLT